MEKKYEWSKLFDIFFIINASSDIVCGACKYAFELAVDLWDRQVIYWHNYVTLVILAFLNKMWRHLLLHFVAIVCTESMLRTGTENINKNLWNFVFFDQMVSYYHE